MFQCMLVSVGPLANQKFSTFSPLFADNGNKTFNTNERSFPQGLGVSTGFVQDHQRLSQRKMHHSTKLLHRSSAMAGLTTSASYFQSASFSIDQMDCVRMASGLEQGKPHDTIPVDTPVRTSMLLNSLLNLDESA